ncbi:hypothetical protein Patl1_10968 [Pistacia atlantica]|uniref:Uncharacterized protein n=1 Tax=Pistacia atlantica TaxID=434234 RepID=A0ACC1A9E2_9ROSI|nr:hypothetical protein Patl1_10968 [Pistacia atlantica]
MKPQLCYAYAPASFPFISKVFSCLKHTVNDAAATPNEMPFLGSNEMSAMTFPLSSNDVSSIVGVPVNDTAPTPTIV